MPFVDVTFVMARLTTCPPILVVITTIVKSLLGVYRVSRGVPEGSERTGPAREPREKKRVRRTRLGKVTLRTTFHRGAERTIVE